MITDEIFRIGKKHIISGFPCEDFALSGTLENIGHSYVAISDGCSGSNGMTDVGARLWCLSYLNVLKKSDASELFFDEDFTIRLLNEFNKISMLPTRQDETASLLLLLANESNAQIMVFGDGGYAIEKNDQTIEIVDFSWKNNKPYYPIFKLEEYNRENSTLIEHFQKQEDYVMRKVTKTFVKKNVGLSNYVYDLVDKNVKAYYFDEVEYGYMKKISIEKENIKSISIFSDGLWTIQGDSLNDILESIVETKEGSENKYGFLKRKIVSVFETLTKENKYPLDDFSMGKIIF